MSDASAQPQDDERGDERGDEIEVTGLRPPLSPRARAQRIAVSLGVLLLVVVVIVGTIPALRFGVLLAVNAVAHEIWPVLPVANAHEQAIAARLQALASAGG